MARKSGDVTLSTFRRILSAMLHNGHDKDSAIEFLFGLNDAEDGESFDTLVKLCDKQEKDLSGYVAAKPGRKAEIDEVAIATETLRKFVIDRAPMTPERLAAMPESNPLKKAFGVKVAEAIKEARAKLRKEKADATIAELAAKFARGEIDSMSETNAQAAE